MGERGVRNAEVVGSIPMPSTILRALCARRMVPSVARAASAGGRFLSHSSPPMDQVVFYTYVLESVKSPGKRYIGSTSHIGLRLARHNAGESHHTAKYRPWRVRLYVAFETRDLASRFERYLKSGSGHAFANRHFWS